MIILTLMNRKNENISTIKKVTHLVNKYRNFNFISDEYNYYYEYKKFKDYFIRYLYTRCLWDIRYYNYSGKPHREDGPAYTHYYKNGKIKYKQYHKNGQLHREDGPAKISYNENGEIKSKTYGLNDIDYSSYEDYLLNIKNLC